MHKPFQGDQDYSRFTRFVHSPLSHLDHWDTQKLEMGQKFVGHFWARSGEKRPNIDPVGIGNVGYSVQPGNGVYLVKGSGLLRFEQAKKSK